MTGLARRARGYMCVPAFSAAPTISGTAKNGQTLTGADGTIVRGSVQSRQWLRDGVAIVAATGSTYACQAADIGHVIAYRVTAVNNLNAANTIAATSPGTVTVVA